MNERIQNIFELVVAKLNEQNPMGGEMAAQKAKLAAEKAKLGIGTNRPATPADLPHPSQPARGPL